MEPHEFRLMADRVRKAEGAMTARNTVPDRAFCKSLYVVAAMKAGEPFTRENVRAIRPGYGLALAELPSVLGRRAARDIVRGEPVARELLV
jgi:sialic acid synthase SpsE